MILKILGACVVNQLTLSSLIYFCTIYEHYRMGTVLVHGLYMGTIRLNEHIGS
jgi:hypothetical protein